jgi:hypothetical protein
MVITPLSKNAIHIFALISANCGSQSIHINVLLHVARQPKAQVEAALIELMMHEYIQYDVDTQHIFIHKEKRREKSHRHIPH